MAYKKEKHPFLYRAILSINPVNLNLSIKCIKS